MQFLPTLSLSMWDRLLGNVNLVKCFISINPSVCKKALLIWNSEQSVKQKVNWLLCTPELGKNKIEINTESIIPNEISFPGRRWGPKHQVLQKEMVKIGLSWDQETEEYPRSKSVFYHSFPPNVIFNVGNLAVLVQKMVQRKLEIRQSVLLPWIIRMGQHYIVELTNQNTEAVFVVAQTES